MTDIYTAVVDVVHAPLNPPAALDFVSDPRFGGIATFIGRVRQHNLGRTVTGISYDLFEPLALRIFQSIGERARREVGGPMKLYIAHAKGDLRIGDLAVVIAAATPHRDEAFRACRLAIEAIKHEAPIWKQEHYVDGHSAWSEGCSLCEEHREAELAAVKRDGETRGHQH
ncbi:molybdenum cofactor biosynthesis protein MoaE [Dyella mobilis]|uniref:Molybdopterin synthase catalytic subunit n=1 Tax=Dyella mobilis TaxID=1849582 RepID=A0ABS2KML9_9GAMM|nr:molybdenum cofactor biosynthesis protein MoaE [Dyella mobilis]MBM7131663.1 molybdenum cofactor biosynthesis protein MoaE [Dyella mobilis]GLQ96362.1 molybdopterin synthase [Dyella mobilis]